MKKNIAGISFLSNVKMCDNDANQIGDDRMEKFQDLEYIRPSFEETEKDEEIVG